jgi:hypothetical protein
MKTEVNSCELYISMKRILFPCKAEFVHRNRFCMHGGTSRTLVSSKIEAHIKLTGRMKAFLYRRKDVIKLIGMNEKKALMAFVSLLLAVMAGSTLAAPVAEGTSERIVGVKAGDWVKYGNFLATWTSNDPSAQEPPLDLVEHNNTEWVTNTVKNVSGARITFQTVTHFKDGTETKRNSYVDINNGVGNGTFAFVSADLSPGESIYNSTEHADMQSNETIQLVYANTLRETNRLKASTSQYWPGEMPEDDLYIVYQIEYFWDKATGVLSERTGIFAQTIGDYSTVAMRSEVMIDTNIWEAAPDKTPPTARAGPDKTAIVDQIVSFDAGGSRDNIGGWGIASYEWDFGDGIQGSGTVITHAFNASRKYTVTLTVEDWAGNRDEDTLSVTVQEAPSSPPIIAVVTLVMLLIAGLFLWWLKAKR